MTNFIETQKNASKGLLWLIGASKVTQQYEDCNEKKYTGKLPYAMMMEIIKKNSWGLVTENGKNGYNLIWTAKSNEAGLTYQPKTGLVNFTFYEGK